MVTRQGTPQLQKNQLKIRWMLFLVFPLLLTFSEQTRYNSSTVLITIGLFMLYNVMVSWGILEFNHRKIFRWLYFCTDFAVFFIYFRLWPEEKFAFLFAIQLLLNFIYYYGRRIAFIILGIIMAGGSLWAAIEPRSGFWMRHGQDFYSYLIILGILNFILGALVRAEKEERYARNEKEETIIGLQDAAKHLLEFSRQMREKASTDALTGLYNHRFFEENLERLWEMDDKYTFPLSLLMIDIDYFKRFNDAFGHEFGNHILKHTAQVIRKNVRKTDYVCRYGGEEFTIILPRTDKTKAIELAERIRLAVLSSPPHFPKQVEEKMTISVGVASSPEDTTDLHELKRKADLALYEAKRMGRNRVVYLEKIPNGHAYKTDHMVYV